MPFARALDGTASLFAIAGAVDGLVVVHAKELLAVYMTGNTSRLAGAVARWDGAGGPVVLVIACFFAASIVAAFVGTRAGPRRARALLLAVAAGLAVAQALAAPRYSVATLAVLAVAMGTLNQVRADEPGVTFVTGTVVKLARVIAGGEGEAWPLVTRWVAFALGAGLAVAADVRLGLPVLAIVAGATATAALVGGGRQASQSRSRTIPRTRTEPS